MKPPRKNPAVATTPAAPFPDTAWSVVWRVDDDPHLRRRRLEKLVQRYWKPVLTVVLSRGLQDADARDATQNFFASLVTDALAQPYDPARGRFRTYLKLAALDFVKQLRRTDRKQHRAENRRAGSGAVEIDPAKEFDRAWLRDVLDRSLEKARGILARRGFPRAVDLHLRFSRGDGRVTFETLGREFDLSADEAQNQIYMTRRLVREIIRDEVRETVSTAEEFSDELRFVFGPRA